MRILYWAENFLSVIGGMEVLAAHFVTELRARGHEVLIVTSQEHGEPRSSEYERIPVRRFPFAHALWHGGAHDMAALRSELNAATQAFRPEVVHVNFNFAGPGAAFYLRVAADFTQPKLATVHVPVFGHVLSVLRTAERVVAVSKSLLGDIVAAAPDLARRASAIPNALSMPTIMAGEATSPEPPVLLCVGRMVHEKGFDVALEAFARLVGEGTDARLLIAGGGPERAPLEGRVAELGLGDRVTFLGWVPPDHVTELMSRASIVVMPSRWREPYGLVALQAAQVGVPCVACAVGGIPEVIEHRVTGLLVPPNDAAALTEALRGLVTNPKLRLAMGQAARERAIREFSLDDFARRHEQLYAQAIAAPARRRVVAEQLSRPRIRRHY